MIYFINVCYLIFGNDTLLLIIFVDHQVLIRKSLVRKRDKNG